MANDIGMDVLKKSLIDHPFRVLALIDNVSLMTTISNDDGYHKVVVNQLRKKIILYFECKYGA